MDEETPDTDIPPIGTQPGCDCEGCADPCPLTLSTPEMEQRLLEELLRRTHDDILASLNTSHRGPRPVMATSPAPSTADEVVADLAHHFDGLDARVSRFGAQIGRLDARLGLLGAQVGRLDARQARDGLKRAQDHLRQEGGNVGLDDRVLRLGQRIAHLEGRPTVALSTKVYIAIGWVMAAAALYIAIRQ